MASFETQILIALIAALTSLIVALISFLSTRRNQRDLADRQSKSQSDLQELQFRLAEQKSARDALRDYEYEARKRLYHECGPLLFQLLEQSESALNRIFNLAQAAAEGNLDSARSWLDRRYYRLSTWHRLLAPLGTFELIQRRLTLVDLSLDRRIYFQYRLLKEVYHSFAEDFTIRDLSDPRLAYDPHNSEAASRRAVEPETYWQQGIPIGILDNAIEASIVKDPETVWRVRTFIEFQNEFELEGGSILRTALERCSYLFEKFHPRHRPVLWRILVIQAYLYRALSMIREEHNEDFDIKSLKTWAEDLRLKLDWRAKTEEESADYSEVLRRPFDTAEKYLSKKLAPLFKPTLSRWADSTRRYRGSASLCLA